MTAMNTNDVLLEVDSLSVEYASPGATPVAAVHDVSFSLRRGEFVGLVGESGSGKSTLGFALTRLQKPPARISGGRILFGGRDIRELDAEELRRQRQGGFAMVLQSGMNALNPVRTVGNHFRDIFAAHGHVPKGDREARARELIGKVGLDASVLARYPGELSGGMRQRASIALALSLEPQLMVFDEPTTALDVLVQHAVMDTIKELQRAEQFTAILISHDLGIVLEATDRVMVMHEGRIVEDAPSIDILQRPKDEYTRMLLSHYADPRAKTLSIPGFVDLGTRRAEGRSRTDVTETLPTVSSRDARRADAAIVVDGVSKHYPAPRRGQDAVTAVDDVSFRLEPGEALALVGASGSGKSTIAKMLTGVEKPTSGTVRFGDVDVATLKRRGLRDLRKDVQMVFQDPYAALNPLHTVEYALTRPVMNYTKLRGQEARARVLELLETVGLTPVEQFAAKLPHQLSGGQRQRVAIAMALACRPRLLIADEPTTALDVTIQAEILSLLLALVADEGMSLVFITHDLAVLAQVASEGVVLEHGRVVEAAPVSTLLSTPASPVTQGLLRDATATLWRPNGGAA
ncbi:ABC transporter ATP-binding protein [Microbacterium sp. AGC62]